MKKPAFTLIEAMIVVFIIGALSMIGAIGFGKVTRQKSLQQAATRIGAEASAVRDYSIFGKQVDSKYPCGYGIAITKGASGEGGIKEVYTSGVGVDRVSAMESDKSCDELIDGVDVALSKSAATDPTGLSLGKAATEETYHYQNSVPAGSGINCLVVLFSAPRGKAYYCASADSGDSCPPAQCLFNPFSEELAIKSDFFLTSLKLTEGANTDGACVSLHPSGFNQITLDNPNCFSN